MASRHNRGGIIHVNTRNDLVPGLCRFAGRGFDPVLHATQIDREQRVIHVTDGRPAYVSPPLGYRITATMESRVFADFGLGQPLAVYAALALFPVPPSNRVNRPPKLP